MIIYSFVPILSVYALWRIQKFWLISLISIPISFGMQLLMGVAIIPSQNQPIIGILLFLMTLGLYIAVCVLLVRHYAQKYNKKIENVGIAVEPKPAVASIVKDLPNSSDKKNIPDTIISLDDNDLELCMDPECFLYQRGLEHRAKQHSPNKNSEKICKNCYHEEKYHDVFSVNKNKRICFGCMDDGLTVFCKEFSETPTAATKENIGKKLEESKRRVEEAEEKLEEKKKRKEESRNKRDIDKQIAINEEKIKKIEEESKKLDDDEGRII